MTEPFENPIGRKNEERLRREYNDEFFALGHGCGAFQKANSQPQQWLRPGADASAIHGRLGCSGCTPAEPYPPNRANKHTEPSWPDQSEKAIAAAAFSQDNDLARNLVLLLNQIE